MNTLIPYKIAENATLLQAVERIEKNRSRAVIVESGDKIIGVISEGDIMRALLEGASIHSPIKSFIIYSFKYLTERDMAQAKNLFSKNLITLLPILDNAFRLIDVITLRDILNAE